MSYSGVFGATDEMHLIPVQPAPTVAPLRQTAAPSVMAPAPYRAVPIAPADAVVPAPYRAVPIATPTVAPLRQTSPASVVTPALESDVDQLYWYARDFYGLQVWAWCVGGAVVLLGGALVIRKLKSKKAP
jgi:hypothetical protein